MTSVWLLIIILGGGFGTTLETIEFVNKPLCETALLEVIQLQSRFTLDGVCVQSK